MPARKKPVLPDDLVDQLMAGRNPSTVFSVVGVIVASETAENRPEFTRDALCYIVA